MIPVGAVEAAAKAAYELKPVELFGRELPIAWAQLSESPLGQRRKDNELTKARAGLEAAAPYLMGDSANEAKLAAVIVAIDPFERVTQWMATDNEVGRYAVEAVHKIRAILDEGTA